MKDLTGTLLPLALIQAACQKEASKDGGGGVALPAPVLPRAAGQLPDPEEGEDQPVCCAASGSEAIRWDSKQPTTRLVTTYGSSAAFLFQTATACRKLTPWVSLGLAVPHALWL